MSPSWGSFHGHFSLYMLMMALSEFPRIEAWIHAHLQTTAIIMMAAHYAYTKLALLMLARKAAK